MTAELGDPEAVKRAFREAAGQAGREEIETAIRDAVKFANRALREAGKSPPEGATLDEWSVGAIADSVEVYWEKGETEGKLKKGNALVAEWTHPHADKIEIGVKPHMIEGDDYLIFEWENMPDEVAEKFRSSWENPDSFLEEPMVAFTEIQHPGIPAVGFIRHGFRRALNEHFS